MQAPTRPSPCSQGVSHLGMNAQNPWFFTGTRSAANDKRCTSEVAPGGPLQSPSGYFRDGVAAWQQERHTAAWPGLPGIWAISMERSWCSAPVLGCSGIGVYFCGWAGCMHEHSHRGEPGNMDQFAGDGMCWSLITLGALGAAGWQLPAPQDKSQASKAGFKGIAAPFGTRCLDMSISNKGRKRSLKAC